MNFSIFKLLTISLLSCFVCFHSSIASVTDTSNDVSASQSSTELGFQRESKKNLTIALVIDPRWKKKYKENCTRAAKKVNQFRGDEKQKVLAWINHQFVFRTTPYCYRNSYDRGVGIVPETRCANGRDRYGALCYNKCPGGYVRQDAGGSNFACVKSCPSGYRKTIQNICEIEKAQRKCDWHCKQGWREVAGGQCRKNGTALLNAKTCYCPDKYNN